MKDRSIFYKDENFVNCWGCLKNGHSTLNCPCMHFCKNEAIAILKCQFSQNQQRKEYNRKAKKKFLNIKLNIQALKKLRLDTIISLNCKAN